MKEKTGILYLVGTPIGNLGDISLRALEVLSKVSLVACEDTRRSRILLNHHGIQARLASLPAFDEERRAGALIEKLQDGEDIALITDAGMPGISDPGEKLVQRAVAAGISVVPIPGPSAAIAALAASGLPTERFSFVGFLPRKGGARRQALDDLRRSPGTLILYESPRRLQQTLRDLEEALGDRRACVARELTKVHEEFVRGRLSDLVERFAGEVLGEITVLVEGAPRAEASAVDPVEILKKHLAAGLSTKDAAAEAAKETGLPRKTLYQQALRLSDAS